VVARVYGRSGVTGEPPRIRVMSGGEPVQELQPSRSSGEANRWDAAFSLDVPGDYIVSLSAPGDSHGIGTPLRVLTLPKEEDDRSADPAFLDRLAEESGGRVIEEDDLAAGIEDLFPRADRVELDRAIWVPMWDRSWYAVLVLLFFAVEWIARRRNGLL
jgi:hypothetical protein